MSKSGTRFYKHYKNKPYKYIGVVRHSETLEEMALYETLYENKSGRLWVRPKDMFFENIVLEGVTRPRFEKIEFEFKSYSEVGAELLQSFKAVYQECFAQAFDESKLQNKLKQSKDFLFLAAYEKSQLVAFKIGYAESKDVFYSWLGCVLPAYEKLGLASELMRQQHEHCKKAGYKVVKTKTKNKFKAMLKLNLDFGFEIVGTEISNNDEIKIVLEKKLETT